MRFAGFVTNLSKSLIANIFLFLKNNSLSREELNNDDGCIKNIHYGDILTKYPSILDINRTSVPFIRDEKLLNERTDYLTNGDVVIADTAEDYLVGKTVEVQNTSNEKLVSGLHTIAIRPKITFAKGYLGFYFNSISFKKTCYPSIQGIKVYSISKSALSKLYIYYPDLFEQTKISCLLTLIEDRINVQNKIIREQNSYILSLCF